MAANLFTPIVSTRTRAVNFFNGRLLSGEDLSAEQVANRTAHSLLGQALGSGIVSGFEVSVAAGLDTVLTPAVTVTKGLAINRNGGTLVLDNDVDIALVRPPDIAAGGSGSVFGDCVPPQAGAYVAGAGVYLLTVSPAAQPQGLAEVLGLSTAAATCNSKYNAFGVQLRLIQLDVPASLLADANKVRNLVAFGCFDLDRTANSVERPFDSPPPVATNFIDALRPAKLTDCDVPLCVLYWTATGGLRFLSLWAVRRRVARKIDLGGVAPLPDDCSVAEGEAMIREFDVQISDLLRTTSSPQTLHATDFFRYLPPAGLLPLAGTGFTGFDPLTFFAGKTLAGPVYIEGQRAQHLLRIATVFPPIDLTQPEMLRGYWVRQNIQAFQQGSIPAAPYLLFASGYIPYLGEPFYDLSHWDLANFL